MDEPIVFISHFTLRDGSSEGFERIIAEGAPLLEDGKPRTVAFLPYIDEERGRASIVHVFPDAEAMAQHFEGAEERSGAAYEFIAPAGFEIYGRPNAAALSSLEKEAEAAGLPLVVEPKGLRGFLRLPEG